MTDDIVKRLRYLAKDTEAYESKALSEAADEIERLRAKLQEIFNLHHNDDDIFIRDDVTYEIVCEALEIKDER